MTNVEMIKCGNVNCFLIGNEKSCILVDTGLKKFRDEIVRRCEGKNVVSIVLTHGHVDHIENALYLSKELGASIGMNEKDHKLIRDNSSEKMNAHTLIGRIVLILSNRAMKSTPIEEFEPTINLTDGYSFNEFGIDASIVELPGHTEGSIGVMVGKDDVIVGDAMMKFFSPGQSKLYGNYDEMKKSMNKVRHSGAKRIHYGHGKSSENK